ncbi:hypothetical protein HXX02_01285 [Microbulbifer elongatus]|uniref:Uncharacterized protein n=1 Tax=Microbulbifer elongatus TaxID=86173 RepID=A0ABT1NW04_9GAMM|nr:hypothetical protein [Microbulbifer elongatus]MCQ3828070.1 hypothetical protein [Microbulbifer elongatus]
MLKKMPNRYKANAGANVGNQAANWRDFKQITKRAPEPNQGHRQKKARQLPGQKK